LYPENWVLFEAATAGRLVKDEALHLIIPTVENQISTYIYLM
jgi:hypothetical protein